jgi:hypothetical protein
MLAWTGLNSTKAENKTMHTTISIQDETEKDRITRFSEWYSNYELFEGEPTVITVHLVDQWWGGPEEGGWWYDVGCPVQNICIFSREQAIKELLSLHTEYEKSEYEEETYDINLSSSYGKNYPEKRPHYE